MACDEQNDLHKLFLLFQQRAINKVADEAQKRVVQSPVPTQVFRIEIVPQLLPFCQDVAKDENIDRQVDRICGKAEVVMRRFRDQNGVQVKKQSEPRVQKLGRDKEDKRFV
eukprot:CAMPEP_0175119124 /NCGR_PEP_ID=MMETSP0086_2-20121207/20000_1 /TAXON_ID=136419 /ORGANISM="Unknown Unknown, Strain D1" /LENGTH=110 /DNA_ID=CAMNT_0016400375 /DNA_START=161 /DNA_END=493 /DNA_ORIENTATION=+